MISVGPRPAPPTARRKTKAAKKTSFVDRMRARAKPKTPRRKSFRLSGRVKFGIVGFGVAGALILIGLGAPQAVWRATVAFTGRTTVAMGLAIDSVTVSGRVETRKKDVAKAVGAKRGEPIFSFDLAAAKARIEALGWVKSATVGRELPDAIRVVIVERTPFAVWQNEGVRYLIDASGEIIASTGLERYATLPEVVGEGAPRATAALMEVLAAEPGLAQRVQACVRVGERRWNVHFKNGIVVRLPEDGVDRAWRRLAELDREKRLLDRDISFVDMRIEDRLVIRSSGAAAELGLTEKDT